MNLKLWKSKILDTLTKEQRKKNMQAIRAKGSKIEIKLSKALFSRGYRYRKNDKSVFGKPDLTFKKYKLAIFCDSEFWHGKNWADRNRKNMSNKEYWEAKIERNIERDKEVNNYLLKNGWKVLRYWGKQIEKDLEKCVEEIEKIIKESNR